MIVSILVQTRKRGSLFDLSFLQILALTGFASNYGGVKQVPTTENGTSPDSLAG